MIVVFHNIWISTLSCIPTLDKTKIRNIKLLLNTATLYDGHVFALEHIKASYGYGNVDPIMMFFCMQFCAMNHSMFNLNRQSTSLGLKMQFLKLTLIKMKPKFM